MVALFFLSVALGTAMAGQLAKLYSPATEGIYFGSIGGIAIAIGVVLADHLAVGAAHDARRALTAPDRRCGSMGG